MTPLQQQMRADLQLRGLSARTQEMSVRAVYQLPHITTSHLPGSRKKHSGTPSSLSSMSGTPHAVPVPSLCVVSRSSLRPP